MWTRGARFWRTQTESTRSVGFRRIATVLAVLGAAVAAGVAGGEERPSPGLERRGTVLVHPLLPDADRVTGRISYAAPDAPYGLLQTEGSHTGEAYFEATGADEHEAVARALAHARAFALRVDELQRSRLRAFLARGRGSGELRAVARASLRRPARFAISYQVPTAAESEAGAPIRGGVLGLLVGALALLLVAPGGALGRLTSARFARVLVCLSAPPVALGVALAAGASAWRYTAALVAVMGLVMLAGTMRGSRRAIRAAVIAVIVISPMRGVLMSLAEAIELPRALVAVNAIQPCLVLATTIAILAHRRRFPSLTYRPLLLGLGAFALAAVLDFATQTVGLSVYAIGFAQYVTYPLFALIAWSALSRADIRRAVHLLLGLALAVSVSVFLQAAGVVEFVQAAEAETTWSKSRYGGTTGSYLHAALFLGTTVPVALGAFLAARHTTRSVLLSGAALSLICGALAMTYGRGGLVVAAVGVAIMVGCSPRRARLRLAIAVTAVIALSSFVAYVGGYSPRDVASRAATSFDWSKDPANEKRLNEMKESVRNFADAPLPQKLLGEGLAATGSARKLAQRAPDSTESYPLKLLNEVGLVGFALIGAFFVWATVMLLRVSWRAVDDPLLRGLGAGGVALSVDSLAFPTLEVQILSMIWWLLLVGALKGGAGLSPRPVLSRGVAAHARPQRRPPARVRA